MGATVKTTLWTSVCLIVVLLLVVVGYRHRKSKPEPAATNESQPVQVKRGTPAGPATNATIGAMGGALASSDGRLAIAIPPGALFSDTAVSIQPWTDPEGIAVGPVYQLLPEGSTFAQPVMLTWQLSDADLAGHQIKDVVIATREGDGGWSRQRGASRDPATKTVKVLATHFSGWAATWYQYLPDISISPEQADVVVSATLPLMVPTPTVDDNDLLTPPSPNGYRDGDLLAPPVPGGTSDKDPLAPPVPNGTSDADLAPVRPPKPTPMPCTNWRVNGVLGGNSTWGTVRADQSQTATFVAPGKVPSRNPVAVSCEAFHGRSKIVAVANVTIKDKANGWHGTFEYTYSESHSNTGKTVAGVEATAFATESRKVTGDFKATTDSMGWGSLDGSGTGSVELITTYGTRNPICSTDGGSSSTGDAKIAVGGSVGSGAGSISINANSDTLKAEQHLNNGCSKQNSHQSSNSTASWGTSCNFIGVDFSKGGTYTADVPSDNGHGKCKVTISSN